MKKLLMVAAAASLVAAPAVAAAETPARASAQVEGESELAGASWVIALLALTAVIAGIVIATDGDDEPVSA